MYDHPQRRAHAQLHNVSAAGSLFPLSAGFVRAARVSQALSYGCEVALYTVLMAPPGEIGADDLPAAAPSGTFDDGCAIAFVSELVGRAAGYSGGGTPMHNGWRLVLVQPLPAGLPPRIASRAPKLRPSLFLSSARSFYIDAKVVSRFYPMDPLGWARRTLGGCSAHWAAFAHQHQPTDPWFEFEAIRRFNRTASVDALRRQEAAYRADAGFVAHVGAGEARMPWGGLLIRDNSSWAARFDEEWADLYMRGSDRDQPAFAYAYYRHFASGARAAHSGGSRRRAGVACGEGPLLMMRCFPSDTTPAWASALPGLHCSDHWPLLEVIFPPLIGVLALLVVLSYLLARRVIRIQLKPPFISIYT